jgi:hypothetical protein
MPTIRQAYQLESLPNEVVLHTLTRMFLNVPSVRIESEQKHEILGNLKFPNVIIRFRFRFRCHPTNNAL